MTFHGRNMPIRTEGCIQGFLFLCGVQWVIEGHLRLLGGFRGVGCYRVVPTPLVQGRGALESVATGKRCAPTFIHGVIGAGKLCAIVATHTHTLDVVWCGWSSTDGFDLACLASKAYPTECLRRTTPVVTNLNILRSQSLQTVLQPTSNLLIHPLDWRMFSPVHAVKSLL